MRKSQLVLNLLLIMFLAAGGVAFFLQSAIALRSDTEIDYGEGIVLWQAANVTDWKRAYRPIEEYPHIVFHYPPLFHLTSRAVAPFTRSLLQAGRLTSILSLAGTCLIGALLTAWALPPGGSRVARFTGSFTAGTLVFTTPMWIWGVLMRVDMLAIFLTLIGVALFIVARHRKWLAFLSFLFFVAAVYTKQTSLAAPIACFVLAWIENPRRARQLLGFAVALGLIVLVMVHTATDGLILRHLITYNQNPYFPEQIPSRLKYHCQYLIGPLLFSAIFPIALLQRRRGKLIRRLRVILKRTVFERCVVVVALFFWVSAFIATATISKQGASDNYFLEMDIAACLLSGLLVAWVARRVSAQPRRGLLILHVFVVLVLCVQCAVNWRPLAEIAETYRHPPFDRSPEVVQFIKSLPGPVYSEDMIVLMRAGKEVPAEPAIITALAADGKWNENGFVARIRNGEFSAVVVRWTLNNPGRFSPAVVAAVEERYYPITDFAPFTVYLPR
jgi:hypothetical protein